MELKICWIHLKSSMQHYNYKMYQTEFSKVNVQKYKASMVCTPCSVRVASSPGPAQFFNVKRRKMGGPGARLHVR